MELKNLVIGDKITDGVYCLKSMRKSNQQQYEVILSDISGELKCELAAERFVESMADYIGGAVKTTFIIKNGLNTTPLGVIKELSLAEEGTFKPSELFEGLTQEKIAEYTASIKSNIRRIPDAGVRSFVEQCLTDDVLNNLSILPASLGYHAKYRGGALATTACVTNLVIQVGLQYKIGSNGLYSRQPDYSLLVAASLLQCIGMVDYVTHDMPFKKTGIGMERGYMSMLQRKIEAVQVASGTINDETLAKILNILAASVPMKTGIKATRREGSILRGCLMLYEELDILDAEIAGHDVEEGEEYFYNAKLRRSISIAEREIT